MPSYTDYAVNIYLINDTAGKVPRFHLSNPALYVKSGDGTTVTFMEPAGKVPDWKIVFKDDSPFCTTKGDDKTKVGQDSDHPICAKTGKMYLTSAAQKLTAPQDYNYKLTGNNLMEDPQVIIGGKGGKVLASLELIAVGVAGLVLGILVARDVAGRVQTR